MTGGLFAILDDIAMLLDDAAMVTKASIKQTSPVLADDLAVNAEKSAGFHASRELPVLWAITKGAFKNKLIILPLAFLLSFVAPWIIAPILIMGGIYLAYEGAEKVYEYMQEKFFGHKHEEGTKKVVSEEEKIKSAILTDFILSIEIVVIALGTVRDQPMEIQVVAVSLVALLAVVGVYGIVALIVRMDDIGFYFIKNSKDDSLKEKFGEMLVAGLPKVVKVLAVVGTIAMLLVAGGIFTHNIEAVHHIHEDMFSSIPILLFDLLIGLIVGYIALVIIEPLAHKFKKDEKNESQE
jgi:predicted DNA repair protein MutK